MFWRELSAFLANLSGMWWSHGVAAGEQTKLQLWVPIMRWALPGLGVGTPSLFRIQRHQRGRDWTHASQAAPGWWFRAQNPPAPLHSAGVWRNLLHFSPAPRFHTKNTAPNYTTGTNWILFWAFQKTGWGLNSMETKLPHEFPRTAPWMWCCKRLTWHLKKYRFQILRLLQFSTFTSIQIHLH